MPATMPKRAARGYSIGDRTAHGSEADGDLDNREQLQCLRNDDVA